MNSTIIVGVHGTLATLAIAAYYRYGDRSSSVEKIITSTDDSLRRLRGKLADDLASYLEPVFQSPGTVPSVIVSPTLSYSEQAVNPVGSERYREAVRDFAELSADAVADYRSMLLARNAWFDWAKRLSWGVYLLLIAEILLMAGLFIFCKLMNYGLDSHVALISLLIPGVLVLFCLTCLPFLNLNHDKILEFRKHHDTT